MNTGYELSYQDFLRLLTNEDDRQSIAPLIYKWFGLTVVPGRDGLQLLDAEKNAVDIQGVYDAIQSDPEQQYTLYQAAMTLWR